MSSHLHACTQPCTTPCSRWVGSPSLSAPTSSTSSVNWWWTAWKLRTASMMSCSSAQASTIHQYIVCIGECNLLVSAPWNKMRLHGKILSELYNYPLFIEVTKIDCICSSWIYVSESDLGTVLKVVTIPRESWHDLEEVVLEEMTVFRVALSFHLLWESKSS